MMKVREVIEEGLGGVREELGKMEACLERLYVCILFVSLLGILHERRGNMEESMLNDSTLFYHLVSITR